MSPEPDGKPGKAPAEPASKEKTPPPSELAPKIKEQSLELHPLNAEEFLGLAQALRHPWRLMWVNFVVAIARGLGFTLGVTVLSAAVLYASVNVLSRMVEIPVLGKHVASFMVLVKDQMRKGPKLP